MKVLVGASSFAVASDKALQKLRQQRIEVILNPYGRKMTKEEISALIADMDGLLAGLEPLDEEVLSHAAKLKAIARIGIGMDNVDVQAAERRGIKVSNTPEGPTEAVAEMTLTACLTLLHQIIPANREIHQGIWKKRMGKSLKDTKVFLIGYGHIGKAVARLFLTMGAEVLIYDKYRENECNVTLEQGLKTAEVISLHASGKQEILTEEMLKKVRQGVIILNSARGGLINEDALYHALKTGKVSWYWGDAHWQEPYQGKITECENAVLTPHICTYTDRCRESMEMQAVENLLADLLQDSGR